MNRTKQRFVFAAILYVSLTVIAASEIDCCGRSTSPANVGVRAGQWVKFNMTYYGPSWLDPMPIWVKQEFQAINGSTVILQGICHWPDGSESAYTTDYDVATQRGTIPVPGNAGPVTGLVIPANSEIGNTVTIVTMEETQAFEISCEIVKSYCGASRTVVGIDAAQLGMSVSSFWDKETGVLMEIEIDIPDIYMKYMCSETNLWEAQTERKGEPLGLDFVMWIVTAIAAVTLVLAITSTRPMKKRSPIEKTPNTELR